jgi:anti-anti-sigma factor
MTTTLPRAPVPLRIEVSFPSPGTARLAVAGEVDLATAPMLGMRILTVLDACHPAVIDVDLAAVTFLDCSGIGTLVTARNTAEQTRCQIRISHPRPMVAQILDMVGLLVPFTAPIVPAEPSPPQIASPRTTRNRFVRMARAMVGRVAA